MIKKILKKYGFIALLLYLSFVGILYSKQRDFIYFPDQNIPRKAVDGVIQDISVTTEDGLELSAWFIKPGARDKPVILFFHGNAGNISHRLFKVSEYINAGYGVLMAEYRGYGGNPSTPTEDGLYKDGRACFAWLNKAGYADKDIVLYGESLGTGVAVQMASTREVKALILETPYARLSDPAQKTYFFIPFIEKLMHDKYRSIDKINSVSAPKLFMIAGKDDVLGPQTGINLYEAAPAPKALEVFDEAGHNTMYQYGANSTVLAFLSAL